MYGNALDRQGNRSLMAGDGDREGIDYRNGGRVKEDLGFGCVCTGARNCLSMLALERKKPERK